MERLKKLPSKYPYTNKNGVVYTLKDIEELILVMQKGIKYVTHKKPEEHNLQIVTSLIKHINNFNPMSTDKEIIRKRSHWFASLIVCRQVKSVFEHTRNSQFANKIDFYSPQDYPIEDRMDPDADTNIFDKLFFDDVCKYISIKGDPVTLKLVQLLYQGYTNKEISKVINKSPRTVSRLTQKLFKIVLDYLHKKEVNYK